jgi:C4-dicarboxylate-specific signal transduction histidine kinase
MIGKNCVAMSSDGYKEIAKESIEKAKQTGVIEQVEKVCDDKYGNKIHVEFSLNLLPDNKTFVVVINSLEDKKKLETLNKSLNVKIKQEVEKSTKQLEMIQKEQLESAKLTSIGALAAGITHEINTPLTYIKGNFELMRYDIDDLESSEIKTRMKNDSIKIIEGIDRIANIIESMKEVSQVTGEKKDLVNIYSTIATALIVSNNSINQITNFYLNGEKFDINIDKNKFHFNAKVQKQRIEQVWIVIIKNALDQLIYIDKFENRKLTIDVSSTDKHVIVKFKDNGGGINQTIMDNIFEPFVSLKEHGGIGVGLNIAKKIVEDQGGEIVAYNENDGAVFEVKLKLD